MAAKGSSPAYTQLVQIDINAGSETLIAGGLGQEACAIANRAVLSPDARKIAYDARTLVSSVCSGTARIFVMDAFTRAVNRLTDYPADPGASDGFPTWVGTDQVGYSSDFRGGTSIYSLQISVPPTSGGLRVPTASEPYYGPN